MLVMVVDCDFVGWRCSNVVTFIGKVNYNNVGKSMIIPCYLTLKNINSRTISFLEFPRSTLKSDYSQADDSKSCRKNISHLYCWSPWATQRKTKSMNEPHFPPITHFPTKWIVPIILQIIRFLGVNLYSCFLALRMCQKSFWIAKISWLSWKKL